MTLTQVEAISEEVKAKLDLDSGLSFKRPHLVQFKMFSLLPTIIMEKLISTCEMCDHAIAMKFSRL